MPSDALLAAWAEATGQGWTRAQRAKSGTPEWFMSYRAAEAETATLRFRRPLLIPGLLQTAATWQAFAVSIK